MTKIKLQGGFDELALLELFYSEPLNSQPEDGYWCYEVTDEAGIGLKFGINVIQESVQIELKLAGATPAIFSFELVEMIEIIDYVKGKFSFLVAPRNQEVNSKIEVELRPRIKVSGATLSLVPRENVNQDLQEQRVVSA